MKNLKEYIKEGLFDDIDKLEGKNGLESNAKQLKKEIIDWICSNYYSESGERKTYLLKKKFLEVDMTTTPPTVDCLYDKIYLNGNAVSLNNNGMFQWGSAKKFDLSLGTLLRTHLKSIEGLPEEFPGEIILTACDQLKNLNGLPKKVGDLTLAHCDSFTSLEGCPEEIDGWFICKMCKNLTSLEGAPKKVGEKFEVDNCKGLSEKEIQWAEKKYGDKFSIKNENNDRPMYA